MLIELKNGNQPLYGLNIGSELERNKQVTAEYLAINGVKGLLGDGESSFWKGEAFIKWGEIIGAGEELKDLTNQAMTNGSFKYMVDLRLSITQPNQVMVYKVDKDFANNLTPGVKTAIKLFSALGIEVDVLSGGWEQTMKTISIKLPGVPIFANKLVNGPNGKYITYEDQRPLAQNNSKQGWFEANSKHFREPIAVLGDGMTDMKVDADLKILFTGHSGERPLEVMEMADVVIENFAAAIPLILGEERWWKARNSRDPHVRNLFEIGSATILSGQGVRFINQEYGIEICERLNRFMDYRIDLNSAPIEKRMNLIYSYTK